jgi:hypothetical protein
MMFFENSHKTDRRTLQYEFSDRILSLLRDARALPDVLVQSIQILLELERRAMAGLEVTTRRAFEASPVAGAQHLP